jgi:hypothetical protein
MEASIQMLCGNISEMFRNEGEGYEVGGGGLEEGSYQHCTGVLGPIVAIQIELLQMTYMSKYLFLGL